MVAVKSAVQLLWTQTKDAVIWTNIQMSELQYSH